MKNIYHNGLLVALLFLVAPFTITARGQGRSYTVFCGQTPQPSHPKQCPETIKLFKAAGELLLGSKSNVWIGPGFGGYMSSEVEKEAVYWSNVFGNDPDPKQAAKFLEVAQLKDVLSWMKLQMTDSKGGVDGVGEKMRQMAVNNAVLNVYGARDGISIDKQKNYQNLLRVGKETYLTIVSEMQKELNESSAQRRAVIDRAYQAAMGRKATDKEINYWLRRSEDFQGIVYAARSYLYAPNGGQDLFETVKRALAELQQKDVSDSAVKVTVEVFRKNKLIFTEMVRK